MGVFMKVSIKHKAPVKMFKLTLCMMCLVVMQGVQGGKLSEEESFLTRVRRASCDPEGAMTCAKDATQTYLDAMFENGQPKTVPEGEKPDYQERKTCNFLLDTEKCFEKLENCGLPADQLKAQKDAAFKQARDAAQQLPNWDEKKCMSSGTSLATSLFLVLVLAGLVPKFNNNSVV